MQEMEQLNPLLQALRMGSADLSRPVSTDGLPAAYEPVVEVINQFRSDVADSLRVLDTAIGQMSVKEALHVLQLRRQTTVIDEQREETDRLSRSVDELAQGVTSVANEAAAAADATQRMAEVGLRSMDLIGKVLVAVQHLKEQAAQTQESVEVLVEQSRHAGQRLISIQAVASTSQMLALNAAIQAAHANNPAFGVVAQEMRRLADQTDRLVKEINGDLKAMETAASTGRAAMSQMGTAADATAAEAQQAVQDLAEIRTLIGGASGAVQNIAAVAEEQAASTEALAAATAELTGKVASAAESLTLTREMAISDLAERAHSALGRFYVDSQNDQMRRFLEQVATELEEAIMACLASGGIRAEALWETDYREIRGAEITSLGRIFDVSRVPPGGFEPPKYRTSWDAKVDIPLIEVLDRHIGQTGIAFLTVLDLNAFAVAQPRRGCQDWTGIAGHDLAGNRIKRFFPDAHSLKAARVALPEALLGRAQIGRRDLEQAGVMSEGKPDARPFLLQAYARDTGEVVMDLATPLYVHGRRWAAVRTGYQARG